jgi:hypothetical protein
MNEDETESKRRLDLVTKYIILATILVNEFSFVPLTLFQENGGFCRY